MIPALFPDPPLRFDARGLVDADGNRVAWPAFGVIGDPVAHSLSPVLHRRALAVHEVSGEYRSIAVAAPWLGEFLDQGFRSGLRGLNVTIPHKREVMQHCAELSEEAEQIGAVNTLLCRSRAWKGHNTDARGLALALERARPRALNSTLRAPVIVGAGGAARAAAVALRALGAGPPLVLARNPERARWVLQGGGRVEHPAQSNLDESTCVLQCTPLGLSPADPAPIDPRRLPVGCLVMDLTYGPQPSALVTGALERGCQAIDGLPMLVAQAALAFALFVGHAPPLALMAEAVGLQW